MGEKRYALRQPDIDLTGDGHGRHVPGTPFVYSHGWHLLRGIPAPKGRGIPGINSRSGKVRLVSKSGTATHDRVALRHFNASSEDVQIGLFKDSGLKLHYSSHLSGTELHQMWQQSNDPEEKAKIMHDIEVHYQEAQIVIESVHRDLLDAQRAAKKDAFRKFDENLSKNAVGRRVIALREKLLTDKSLDRITGLKEQVKEHGLDWAKHAATGVAVSIIVGHLLGPFALIPLAKHFGGPAGGEAMKRVMESRLFESGVAAVVSMHLTQKAFGPLEHLLSKERKIEKAKKALKTTTKKR